MNLSGNTKNNKDCDYEYIFNVFKDTLNKFGD